MKPAERSRTRKQLFKKLPGGATKKFTKRRISTHTKCAICKTNLQGTTTKKVAKTQKHPTRKFGGNLCHKCTKEVIILKTRISDKTFDIKDADPKYRRYL